MFVRVGFHILLLKTNSNEFNQLIYWNFIYGKVATNFLIAANLGDPTPVSGVHPGA